MRVAGRSPLTLRPCVSGGSNAPKHCGELVFHLAIFEDLRGRFFWQYRSADGWVIGESEALFSDPHDCIENATGQAARILAAAGANAGSDRRGA